MNEVFKNVIHHCLKGGRQVAEAKEHDTWFIQPSVCPEGCLVLISLLDVNIVETPSQVKLHEILGTAQSVQDVRDKWEWVRVFDHHCVELLVVLDEVQGSIFLLDEEYWGTKWRF